jgi:CRP/FNR family transcriptional regulator, cyclic AMP receptor protein
LAAAGVEVEFPAGRTIAREGEIGTGLFVIESGAVHVARGGVVVARLGPGDFFGELSVLDGGPRIAAVIADAPTVCLAIATWDLERVLTDHPGAALAVLRVVAARLREESTDHHS